MVRRVFILEQKVGNDKEYIMTVGELMDKLRKYNRGTKVMLDIDDDWNNYSREIEDIYEDYLVDVYGRSSDHRCVYINTDLKK